VPFLPTARILKFNYTPPVE